MQNLDSKLIFLNEKIEQMIKSTENHILKIWKSSFPIVIAFISWSWSWISPWDGSGGKANGSKSIFLGTGPSHGRPNISAIIWNWPNNDYNGEGHKTASNKCCKPFM